MLAKIKYFLWAVWHGAFTAWGPLIIALTLVYWTPCYIGPSENGFMTQLFGGTIVHLVQLAAGTFFSVMTRPSFKIFGPKGVAEFLKRDAKNRARKKTMDEHFQVAGYVEKASRHHPEAGAVSIISEDRHGSNIQ